MIRNFQFPYLLVVLFTFWVYGGKYGLYSIGDFWSFYFADFLFLPFTLPVARFITEQVFARFVAKFKINLLQVAFIILLTTIYFEFYLSKVNDRYTYDTFDVLAYFLGGAFFYFFQNPDYKLKLTPLLFGRYR
jgi:hypothetical protein